MRLIRSKFKSWLKTKPPAAVVGENRDCHACPIALFYEEASGGCEVVIFDDGDGYTIDRGYSKKPLPYWAQRFIFLVDGDCDRKISAGRSLEVLEQIS